MLIHALEFNFRLWMGLLDMFHEAWAVLAYMLLAVPDLQMPMTRKGDMQGESKVRCR
jgi:hypothetical protein